MEFTVKQIASLINGTTEGNPDAVITDVSKIEEGKKGALTFLANPKYAEHIYDTKATAVIVNKDFELKQPVTITLIRVDNAYQAFAKLLDYYKQIQSSKEGISEKAVIEETAKIGKNTYIGANAYIGEHATIEDGASIYPNCFVGDGSSIGAGTILYAGVSVYNDCKIGSNCIIHSGAVIGADGFGFAPQETGSYKKIPQIGNVIIEDNVEVGANTTIDRATMGSTIIRTGVKLDNVIQVAHNVEIGEHTVIASQVGIAGSVKIGAYCQIGGQVGFAGHIEIADRVKIGAQSGIIKNITTQGAVIQGSPGVPFRDFFKSQAVFMRLPEIDKKIDKLLKDNNINSKS